MQSAGEQHGRNPQDGNTFLGFKGEDLGSRAMVMDSLRLAMQHSEVITVGDSNYKEIDWTIWYSQGAKIC